MINTSTWKKKTLNSRKCQGAAGKGAREDPQPVALARARTQARPRSFHVRRAMKPLDGR